MQSRSCAQVQHRLVGKGRPWIMSLRPDYVLLQLYTQRTGYLLQRALVTISTSYTL